jgi:hypothetical protein
MMLALTALSALANPKTDCPARVSELPAHDQLDPADPRWAAPVVVILKEARRGMVFVEGQLAAVQGGPACWQVGLGSEYPPGHKVRQGDRRTPEGWYPMSDRPWSAFPHALTVHYPDARDAERGLRDGLVTQAQHDAILAAVKEGREPPSSTRLGGKILLHGGGGWTDWTLGCVAFDDAHILALRTLLPQDLRANVLILP